MIFFSLFLVARATQKEICAGGGRWWMSLTALLCILITKDRPPDERSRGRGHLMRAIASDDQRLAFNPQIKKGHYPPSEFRVAARGASILTQHNKTKEPVLFSLSVYFLIYLFIPDLFLSSQLLNRGKMGSRLSST